MHLVPSIFITNFGIFFCIGGARGAYLQPPISNVCFFVYPTMLAWYILIISSLHPCSCLCDVSNLTGYWSTIRYALLLYSLLYLICFSQSVPVVLSLFLSYSLCDVSLTGGGSTTRYIVFVFLYDMIEYYIYMSFLLHTGGESTTMCLLQGIS